MLCSIISDHYCYTTVQPITAADSDSDSVIYSFSAQVCLKIIQFIFSLFFWGFWIILWILIGQHWAWATLELLMWFWSRLYLIPHIAPKRKCRPHCPGSNHPLATWYHKIYLFGITESKVPCVHFIFPSRSTSQSYILIWFTLLFIFLIHLIPWGSSSPPSRTTLWDPRWKP